MLVLSRKKNEAIKINDNITIVVVEIRGDKVRLGINAPKEITVHRQEVYEAIQAENPKTIYTDVDDGDWDSSQGYPPGTLGAELEFRPQETMINEGCPNTEPPP